MCGCCAARSRSATPGSSSSRTPTAPARWSRALEKEAEKLGAELTVLDTPVLAEVLYQRMRPALVVGCFSTALLTASAFYGLPVARVGTEHPARPADAVPEQQPCPGHHRRRAAARPGRTARRSPGSAGRWTSHGADRSGHGRRLRDAAEDLPGAARRRPSAISTRASDPAHLALLQAPPPHLAGAAGGLPAQLAFIPRNATVRRVARLPVAEAGAGRGSPESQRAG